MIVIDNRDPNCREYINGVCNACSTRHFVGQDGKCIPVNPLCRTHNNQGQCVTCYEGYSLIGATCGISVQ